MPKFGNEGARKLITDLEDEGLRTEAIQILTSNPPEGKKGYSQKSVNAAITEARLQRRRKASQAMIGQPIATEFGAEQGGQMRLPGFPLPMGLEEAPAEATPEEPTLALNEVMSQLPGLDVSLTNRHQRKGIRGGFRTAPPAQQGGAALAEQTAAPAPAEVNPQQRKSLAEVFSDPKAEQQRRLAADMLRSLASEAVGENAAKQRDVFNALAAAAPDPKYANQIATAFNTLADKGLVPPAFINQLTAAPAAPTQAPETAKVSPDDRQALYTLLADRDVTIKADVGGKEATVTINAADALRDADMLVSALEEMREVCG